MSDIDKLEAGVGGIGDLDQRIAEALEGCGYEEEKEEQTLPGILSCEYDDTEPEWTLTEENLIAVTIASMGGGAEAEEIARALFHRTQVW